MSPTLDRIAALLAKAEGTDNPAEADAYMMKAQALATQASVDLAVARARSAAKSQPSRPISRTVTIGEKGKRANSHLVSLYVVIAHPNGVQVDVAHNSTYVIGYGLVNDLDVIDAMFASLATQMVAAANEWLKLGAWKSESYVSTPRSGNGWRRSKKPHTAQTARAAFYRAYVERIGERLEAAQAAVVQRTVVVDEGAAPVSGEMVLRSRDVEVRTFYRTESKARGAWSGYSGQVSGRAGSATRAGRDAAARARLGGNKELPGRGPAIGR